MVTTQGESLTVGKKVYKLRKHRGITQEELAEIIKARKDKIVRVERGEDEYTSAHLDAIRVHFGINELPLTDHEVTIFYKRLYYFRTLIRVKRLSEAHDIQSEFGGIDNLSPYDPAIVTLCKVFESQLLIADGCLADAKSKLELLDPTQMNDEILCHYLYSMGYLAVSFGNYENGLVYLNKAYDLVETNENLVLKDDERLYYNLALCYTYIEMPYKAIFFITRARQIYTEDKMPNFNLNLDHMLALNYINTNQLYEAKKTLDKCLIEYKCVKDEPRIGVTLFYLGNIYKKVGDWAKAIDHYEDALNYLPTDMFDYFASLHGMIYCTVQARSFTKAGRLLEQARSTCNTNELWQKYFDALEYYLIISSRMTVPNSKASDYLENVAIPHLCKHYDYFLALDYFKLLEQHYEKTQSIKKSLLMTKETLKIYERCLIRHGKDIKL